MSDQLEKLLAQEPMKKPPSRWVNWWVDVPICERDVLLCDEPYADCEVWPSKEIAEQKAQDELLDDWVAIGACPSKWLGAFPEGERP